MVDAVVSPSPRTWRRSPIIGDHTPGACSRRGWRGCIARATSIGLSLLFVPFPLLARGIVCYMESRVSPNPLGRPTDEEVPSPDILPIDPEDLTKLGIEPQLIPSTISTILSAEQPPNGSPLLGPAEVENVVEILDKVFPPPCISPRRLNPRPGCVVRRGESKPEGSVF